MDTSNRSIGDQKKEQFSPTKFIAEMARLESDRLIKTAEIETRKFCYKSLNAVHDDIVREDPTINQANFQRLEYYQLAETTKRLEEIKDIDKKMQEICEHAGERQRNVQIVSKSLFK